MSERDPNDDTPPRKLAAAITSATTDIIKAVCAAEAVTLDEPAQFMLSSLVIDYARLIALDAAAFAAHRGRARIGAEDVKLCVRRDPALVRKISAFEAANIAPKKKRAPRPSKVAAAAAAAATAAAAGVAGAEGAPVAVDVEGDDGGGDADI